MLETFFDFISPYYYYLILIISCYFFIICLGNLLEISRFSLPPKEVNGPFVSVLLPARNEEKHIERCLAGLRNQTYTNYEILVLDDNSTDRTSEILNRIAAEDDRIRIFAGAPLPIDWYGKAFALDQLVAQAKGEFLVFTDADTVHEPTSISWAVTNMKSTGADMISGYIGQIFGSFGELITVSLMYILTGFAIPIFLNRFLKISILSIAIGQFIIIKKTVLEAIGGCATFKKETPEDMYMSKYLKRSGYKTRFLNIAKHVTCRMYDSYYASVEGIGKNLIGFFGKSATLLFLLIIGVITLFITFPLFIFNIVTADSWLLFNSIFICLFTITWILVFAGQRLKWWYGFLWPILMLNLIYVATWSWFRNVSDKGFLWKGRTVGKRSNL